jgi:transposase
MERIPKGIYTKELREEAVRSVLEEGESIPGVGRRLSISPSTIPYWVKASKEGNLLDVGRQQRPLTEIEMELARVKRELAQVKMERDILKKATGYFAKKSLPGAHDEGDATLVFHPPNVLCIRCIPKRVLQMAEAQAFKTSSGRGQAGSGDQGCTQENTGDLWAREAAA